MTTITEYELPEPGHRGPDGTGSYFDSYTAKQMHQAYAAGAVSRARQYQSAVKGRSDFRNSVKELRAELADALTKQVSRFDEDRIPVFTQGAPTHELAGLVDAEWCTWAVKEIDNLRDQLVETQAQAKTLATANSDNARELQERIESLQYNLSDAMQELYKVRAEATTIIQSLESQLAALRAQESGGGPYPEGHANYYMRTRVAGTLSIGHAVYDAPITQEPVNNDAEDARRYRWLADYFIGDSNEYDDAIVAAKTRQEMNGVIDDARKQGETK